MTTSYSTPSAVVDNPVTARVAQELERRGFGSTVARWIAHSIEVHGLKHTVETLGLTLYDVEQTAKVDEHNAHIMLQVWRSVGSSKKSPHLPQ